MRRFTHSVVLYVDGGTRHNQICMVDYFKDKTIVKKRGVNPTNNDLEYLALYYAIQYANNNYSKKNILIYSDSMLVVNQMNGKWRVTTESLKPLFDKCQNIMTEKIKIKWISRKFNRAGWVLETSRDM
jgi:ribonuclease HI